MGGFRWGVMGTGPVARKFALGLKALPDAEVSLAVSRDAGRAASFAQSLGIARSMGGYAEAATAADVDGFYIATPPALHRAHAEAAIAAGKPVLIEKPMAHTAADARAIAELARARGVPCLEGMWTRFMPAVRRAKELIDSGAIGEPRLLEASFAIADVVDGKQSLFDPALGGGVLNHRAVYPISLAIHFFGPVMTVVSSGRLGTTGVDEDVVIQLRHASGAMSVAIASCRTNARNDLVAAGTKGRLILEAPIYRPSRLTLLPVSPRAGGMGGTGGGKMEALREGGHVQRIYQDLAPVMGAVRAARRGKRLTAHYAGNGYHYEAQELMRLVRSGTLESPIMPLEESLAVMSVIDEVRAQLSR